MKWTPQNNSPSEPSRIGSKYIFLVIDEDATDLRLYSALLQREGYEVRASTCYAEALGWLESLPFDFIIVSQGTHRFEGRPVLERAIAIDRRLPVIVLTRVLDMGCYLEALHLGALDYFEKPVMPDEFLRLIKRHLPARAQLECAVSEA